MGEVLPFRLLKKKSRPKEAKGRCGIILLFPGVWRGPASEAALAAAPKASRSRRSAPRAAAKDGGKTGGKAGAGRAKDKISI